MHPKGRINKPKQTEMRVDLTQAETIQCEKCTNNLFITSLNIILLQPSYKPYGGKKLILIKYENIDINKIKGKLDLLTCFLSKNNFKLCAKDKAMINAKFDFILKEQINIIYHYLLKELKL